MRSALTSRMAGAPARIASQVAASISKSSVEAKRTPRKQTKFVFCKAIGGISDGAQDAYLQIVTPPHKVEHSFFDGIVK